MSSQKTNRSTRRLSDVARHVCVPAGIETTAWPGVEARKWDIDGVIFNAKAFNHSLYGNFTGGGHLHGYGWMYDKPEFPESWTLNDLFDAAHEVLTTSWDGRAGAVAGEHDGVDVTVAVRKTKKGAYKVASVFPTTR